MPEPAGSPRTIYSQPDIARILGRNHVVIYRTVRRLKLKCPFETPSGLSFFDEAQLTLIQENLPKPASPR